MMKPTKRSTLKAMAKAEANRKANEARREQPKRMNTPTTIEPTAPAVASSDWLDDGQKFKIVITLECELVTDEPGATKDQIRDMMFADPAYGLKSIVAGTINPSSKDEHDTEILWDSTTIEVV